MDQLIEKIYGRISEYRKDENEPSVLITKDHILNWICQFEDNLRIPILIETENILKRRFCSKASVKYILEKMLTVFTKDFQFSTEKDFLLNADFIDLQQNGKSQKIMLSLFDELIQMKYNVKLAECGSISKKYSIYMDDILCTGLTLIKDTQEWAKKLFSTDKTNLQAVSDNSTTLVFAYIFSHGKNYQKKKSEMSYKISDDISSKHKMYRSIEIENNVSVDSKLNLLIPTENEQPQAVIEYKNKIVAEVDEYTQKYNKISSEEFFRPIGFPKSEDFFTSKENRNIVENAFLSKGIEILGKANVSNKNIRALGYSLPSLKNCGFGALCFTWRNVPNNAPLVFWYSGGGFTPLFKVHRGRPLINFDSLFI